jgi:hypothetical protein
MFHSAEQEKRIQAEQAIMRSGKASSLSLCQHKNLSCVRCCLPHIGGDSHVEDSGELQGQQIRSANRYLGPGKILMKFKNFNSRKDPRIEASQYEDSLPDVGREEMERRFSERRNLFLEIYDRKRPRQSLPLYMESAQRREGYTYRHTSNAGPTSQYLGGSVPTRNFQKGELPECQLLGFTDAKGAVGCLAHPLAETSQGYDGRDQVGFFHHSGCCNSIGCEASEEFRLLSVSALKVFDKAVEGMSWYAYSRHATSVLVYYLRSYDHIFQKLDEMHALDALTLPQIVEFTNSLYDKWPMQAPDCPAHDPGLMNAFDMLSADIPITERILFIALNAGFVRDHFDAQLKQARVYVEGCIETILDKK